eukprot:GHVS01010478.1.p2 GENE.GHVS01010478.1~~GHVS01010478.1.p2  ORF type:complete len:183 (+),score=34.78 GHVS01010478.1:2548-3096(+)
MSERKLSHLLDLLFIASQTNQLSYGSSTSSTRRSVSSTPLPSSPPSTDDVLVALGELCGSGLLSRALKVIDQRRLSVLVASPSGRILHQVSGSTETYFVLPGFCSCRYSLDLDKEIMKNERPDNQLSKCKHELAVLVATALAGASGFGAEQTPLVAVGGVSDEQMSTLIWAGVQKSALSVCM